MAAGNWIAYNAARLNILNGNIDLSADSFKVALLSATYTPNAETHTQYSDLTNEVANGNGYLTGGPTLDSVTLTRSTTTVTFDAADEVISASGGDIGPFRYAVIYSDTSTGDLLLCYSDLGDDFTILNGNDFTLQINASGILTLTGAAS